ncbi:MAG: glycosyltransferase [Bacteroidetes bacterium]|nr:glycosyltransferase [Bacteroidota bacterium]
MIVILLNTVYLLLLLWYRQHWQMARTFFPETLQKDELPSVSVIVPVRNETKNLNVFLNQLATQNYPKKKVEWIFVNDQSEDNSLEILNSFTSTPIVVLSLQPSEGKGKKFALKKGIEQARGSWIVTTDADCTFNENWILSLIESGVDKNADMVCGTVQVNTDNSFMQNFQAMESGIFNFQEIGSLYAKYPLLNTGASLAFKKDAWLKVQGYATNEHIASGDDTFLMLSMHQQNNLKVIGCPTNNANVSTHAVNSWQEIIGQRLRWNGKVKHYRLGYIHVVGSIVFLAALSWVYLLFEVCWNGYSDELLLLVFAMRLTAEFTLLKEWQSFTGKKFSWIHIFLMSFIYPLFTVFSMVFRPFMKNSWKGRTCE